MRMERVNLYTDRFGRQRVNTDRLLVPFRLMVHPGEWCEVEETPRCLAGNLAALCSQWSHKLGRRFTFRDMKNGTYRVTVTNEVIKPKKRGATRSATRSR